MIHKLGHISCCLALWNMDHNYYATVSLLDLLYLTKQKKTMVFTKKQKQHIHKNIVVCIE